MRCLMRLLPVVRQSSQVSTLRTFFGRGGDPFSEMFRQMDRTAREMEKIAERMDLRGMMFPSFFPRTRAIPVETSTGNNLYACRVNLEGFKPEDIKVTCVDGNVTIKAKKETKESNGNSSLREAVYCYSIPENVNIEGLRSRLENDGTLVIEAPLLKLEAPKSQEIPIDKQTTSKKE